MTGALGVLAGLLLVFGPGCSAGGDDDDKEGGGTDCMRIDRADNVRIIPPAGVRVGFRVLGCDGYPVRELTDKDVRIINDEKGKPFGAGPKEGDVSDLGNPSNFGLFSVLALDMSDSIFNSGSVDDVIDGAQVFVTQMVKEPASGLKHRVALIAFGRPDAVEKIRDFTGDYDALSDTLEALRKSESRGSTDLYGAYLLALSEVARMGASLELVERFAVILTDGTHEAGDEQNRHEQAMSGKSSSSAFIYSIGIQGNYDESKLEELASNANNFVKVEKAGQLRRAFAEVAEQVEAVAKSNYVVGVCTPVSLGSPTLTIEIDVDGATASKTIPYSVSGLNGDVASCDPDEIADPCGSRECGPSWVAGIDCGACPGETDWCNAEGQCVDDCAGLECGRSPNAGHDCGACGGKTPFCVEGECKKTGYRWKAIAGGTFQMGSDRHVDEQPVHGVTVPSFEMLETEVTVSQYAVCVNAGGCSEPLGSSSLAINWDLSGPKAGREEYPVNGVDWSQARDFCAWIGGRLPSEAEWEYAARSGGRDIVYPWGDEEATCSYALMDEGGGWSCGGTRTAAEVCSKTAGNTDQGLCDMAGNVWEWVEDDWHYNYSGAPDDGSSWIDSPRGSDRVKRGGSFYSGDYALRTAVRVYADPSIRVDTLGFRCAR